MAATDCISPAFQVKAKADPFSDLTATMSFAVGKSIADVLTDLKLPTDETVQMRLNGDKIYARHYANVYPKEGSTLWIEALPGAAATAAYAVSQFIIGAYSLGATATSFLQIGTALALAYDVGTQLKKWYDQSTHRGGTYRGSEAASLEGNSLISGQNQKMPFRPLPFVLGERRFAAPLGGNTFAEVEGDDEHLNTILCWGPSPVSVRDIRIGATSLSSFSDTFRQSDYDGIGSIDSYPDVKETRYSIHLIADTWHTYETNGDVDKIGITIELPDGLYRLRNAAGTANFGIEYRLKGASDWIEHHAESVNRYSATRIVQYEEIVPATRGRYEIRVRRENPGEALQPQNDGDLVGRAFLSSIKSISLTNPVNTTGVALDVFRVKATNQLNGSLDEINGIAGIKVPLYNRINGAWSSTRGISKNPADLFRFILSDDNVNERPLGLNQIDDASLGEWWEFCEDNDFEYSKIVTGEDTIYELLGELGKAGKALPRSTNGKWGVIINKPQASPVQMFTPRNSYDFRQSFNLRPLPHAFRVQFSNEEVDWQADEIVVYDEGYSASNATRYETISLPGVCNADQAYKLARYALAAGRLRPYTMTFSVDYEHLVCELGDRVKVQYDSALIGQIAGRIKSVSSDRITLDEAVTFETGKEYGIVIRKDTGEPIRVNAYPSGALGSTHTILLDSTAGFQAGDQFAFGERNYETEDCIIAGIEPLDDLGARITVIPYAPEVFNASEYIPPFTSNISLPIGPSFAGPTPPIILSIRSDETALPKDLRGVPSPTMLVEFSASVAPSDNISITLPVHATIRWREVGEATFQYQEVLANAGRVYISPVRPGVEYEIGVRLVDARRGFSTWTTTTHSIEGLGAAPPPVDSLQATRSGSNILLEWPYANPPGDAVAYEIRYHFDKDVEEWDRMLVLRRRVSIDQRSATVPGLNGSYGIKVIDAADVYSSARYVNAPFDESLGTAILDVDEHPAFAQTKSNVAVSNGTMKLALSSGAFVGEGTYTSAEHDLGSNRNFSFWMNENTSTIDVLNNKVVSWPRVIEVERIVGGGITGATEVIAEIRLGVQGASGAEWSDWQSISKGDFTARYVQIRLTLKTTDPNSSPVINRLSYQAYAK